MSLRDFPDLFKHLPQHKPWVITISVISVVVVLAVCTFGSWQLLREENQPVGLPSDGPSVAQRDITTRDVDSTPMTVANAFPNREVAAAEANWPPYVMIGEAQASDDCTVAADGEVRRQLTAAGCSQVLRASFASGDNLYFVTTGIVNLPSVTVATSLSTDIRELVESGQGRFLGYISDPDAKYRVLYTAAPHLAWEVRGHFLLYTVVVRQDGADMATDEGEYVVYDMLKAYLRDTVLEQWAVVPETPADPGAGGDPSAAGT